MSARLNTVKIAPYNQVFALTQHMINQGIDNLYTKLLTSDTPHDSQEPVTIKLDKTNFIEDVVFGAPNVIVDADFSNVKSVRLRLKLKSGRVQLNNYIGTDKKGKDLEEWLYLKVNDWTITIPVDVGFVKVDKTTDRGKAIEERSAAKGKPNHSIYELLVDLTTMTAGNAKWDLGVWDPEDIFIGQDKKQVKPQGYIEGKPRDYISLDKSFREIMRSFIERMASRVSEWNLNSMGFAVAAEDANKRATFEVNDVRYMTYPWTDPDTRSGVEPGLSGNGRLNYLLYLETVGTHKPIADSDPSSVLSTRMGNWTDGRNPSVDKPSTFGSFVLNSDMFMGEYLLPKLSCINRVMSADIHSVEAKAWVGSWLIIYYQVSARWGVGQGEYSKEATQFALSKNTILDLPYNWSDDLKRFMQPLTVSPGHGATVWAYKDVEYGDSAKHADESALGLKCECHGDTVTYSRVYTLAGDNRIVFEGRIWTKLEYIVNPPIGWKDWQRLTAKIQWKVTFTLGEVSDGGMQIKIDSETPTPEVIEEGNDQMFTNNGPNYKEYLLQNYNTAFQNLNYYLNNIRNSLQGAEKFTLPASGVFFFKNPMMDHQGNLLCGLEYNGNPETAVNSDGEQRTPQPQATYTDMPGPATNSGSGEKKAKE